MPTGNIWVAWHAGDVERQGHLRRQVAGRQANLREPGADHQQSRRPVQSGSRAGRPMEPCTWSGRTTARANGISSASISAERANLLEGNGRWPTPTTTRPLRAVAVEGSPNTVYVAWQDDQNGNQDIYVGSSTNAFASVTATRVTTNTADQTEPDLAVGVENTIYLVWTDAEKRSGGHLRSGFHRIVGQRRPGDRRAASRPVRPWPWLRTVPTCIWCGWTPPRATATSGMRRQTGCPPTPLAGENIIDDTSAADQTAPALTCTPDGKVFACWQDCAQRRRLRR